MFWPNLCAFCWLFVLKTRRWNLCAWITLVAWPLLVIAFWGFLMDIAIDAVSLLFGWVVGAIKGLTASVEISGQEGGDDVDV